MISDIEWNNLSADERHEKTWRRPDGSRVYIKDMETAELQQVIRKVSERIDREEGKLITDPNYEVPAVSQRVNRLIANSKEKLVFLKQELKARG